MKKSLIRIKSMFMRYAYLHKRSMARTLEFFFWPVMSLLVWGFVTTYFQSIVMSDKARVVYFLISAMIFWDVLYRAQQTVTLAIAEDIWTHNIQNVILSPLRLWEWMASMFLFGLIKVIVVVIFLSVVALGLYRFHFFDMMGFYLFPFMASLLFFGWGIGVMTSGLLLRWGHAVEALIWGIPFLIQPLSAVFYPVATLPIWLQFISKLLPSTYVFEGIRSVTATGAMNWSLFGWSVVANLIFFVLSSVVFMVLFREARSAGRLGRLGMD